MFKSDNMTLKDVSLVTIESTTQGQVAISEHRGFPSEGGYICLYILWPGLTIAKLVNMELHTSMKTSGS